MKKNFSAFFSGQGPLWLIVAAAAILRVLVTVEHRSDPLFTFLRLDEIEYDEWAQEVMSGSFFLPFVPNHAPGYAWFLGAGYRVFGYSLLLPRLLQTALGLGSLLLVFAVSRRLWDRRAGLLSALLFGMYWPLLVFEQRILAVALFVFLDLVSLFFTVRAVERDDPCEMGLAGFFLGAAALVRPTALVWLPVFFLWLAIRAFRSKPRRVQGPAVFLAAALVPLLPALWKNHSLSGRWSVVQSDFALNLYLGNNPDSDGTPYARLGGGWDRIESLPVRKANITDLGAQEKFYVREVLRFLKEDPADLLQLLLVKSALLVNRREIRATIDPEFHRSFFRVLSLPLPGFALVLGLALGGVPAFRFSRGGHQALLLFLVAYSLAVIATVVSGRYRAPVAAGLIVMSGAGLVQVCSSLQSLWRSLGREKKLTKKALWSPALLGAGLLLAHLPVGPSYTAAEEWAFLGQAWMERGDEKTARSCYEKALSLDPRHPDALMGLGRLAEKAGDLEGALRWQKAAVAADPWGAAGHLELGRLLWKKGALKSAYQEFLAAAECRPQWLPAQETLALFEAQMGMNDRAVARVQNLLRLWPNLSELRALLVKLQEPSPSAVPPAGPAEPPSAPGPPRSSPP